MASASAAAASGRGARNLLQFLRLVGQLKRVPRTGWVYRNVERPESVSDHMYRMAVMALVTKDDHLNKDRCVRLALVHDLAECIVGDIAPADNIPKEEKHRREEEAMKQLTQLLSKDLGKELYELWEEYETQSSAEAKFVKQLDQCEMILQASEYEDLENKPGRLQDFYDGTAVACEVMENKLRVVPCGSSPNRKDGPGIVFFCVGAKHGRDRRIEPLMNWNEAGEMDMFSCPYLFPVFLSCRKIQSP
ncbi:HD domain containing 2 [Rhinolophus ferrumequinum]|uniref:5'-deoxynucleotidase HDDC2 n=1 Tax=Rhinolophus ferrumequinum TaxID=59479 RepID=A0A7J7YRW2_RHIFE|nr:HD domain containing 2 [Rhinolophus ferrumequinum]